MVHSAVSQESYCIAEVHFLAVIVVCVLILNTSSLLVTTLTPHHVGKSWGHFSCLQLMRPGDALAVAAVYMVMIVTHVSLFV